MKLFSRLMIAIGILLLFAALAPVIYFVINFALSIDFSEFININGANTWSSIDVQFNEDSNLAWFLVGIPLGVFLGSTCLGIGFLLLIAGAGKEVNLDMQSSHEERSTITIAALCHLSSLCGYFFPLGGLLGPLSIWLLGRNKSPLIDHQGIESINFRLSYYLYTFIAVLFCVILVGVIGLIVLPILDIILTIYATVKVAQGNTYRYPLTLRFIKDSQ